MAGLLMRSNNVDTHTRINTVSICAGYEGIGLGLRAVLPRSRTILYIENEVTACQVLAQRMADEHPLIDVAPIFSDLRSFNPAPWAGRVALLHGGFPCQPHSVAGKKKGIDDSRELSGDVLRIAEGLGCPTLFLENVPGIKRFYFDNIRPRLFDLGYEVVEGLFSASETGAPHRRQRLFILAYHEGDEGAWRIPNGGDGGRQVHSAIADIRYDVGSIARRSGPELSDSGSIGLETLSEIHDNRSRPKQDESSGRHASGCGETDELSHAEHFRCPAAEVGEGQPETIRGSEEGQNGPVQPAGIRSPRDAPSELADALIDGDRGWCEGLQPEDRTRGTASPAQVARSGGALGDTDNGRGWEDCQPPELRTAGLEQSSCDCRSTRQGEDAEVERGDDLVQPRLPLYPPGPADETGWHNIIIHHPLFAPTYCRDGHTVQSEVSSSESYVRRVPDGPTAGLGIPDTLRLIGNGVVPATASTAWLNLTEKAREEIE